MRQFLPFLLFLLLLTASAMGQDRMVSGVLTADDGSPLAGVNIAVKGTNQGTTSDANGRYSIRAPLGSTLVFSFIGYTTYKVVVTERGSAPVGGKATRPATTNTARRMYPAGQVQDTVINRRGVASLTDASPGYVQKGNGNKWGPPVAGAINGGMPTAYSIKFLNRRWARLWYGSKGENGLFVVKDQYTSASPFRVNFSSSFTLDQVNRLPLLQNQYAQGRPHEGQAIWRGPETGEVLSWGPALNSLEYTGTPYEYDRSGPLTTTDNGNGLRASAYSPYAFFRMGTSIDNALTVSRRMGDTRLSVSVSRKDQQNIIPGSGLYRNNLNAKLGTKLLRRLSTDYSLALSETGGTLLHRGANLTNIISSVFRTPPSFDNANGIAPGKAFSNPNAWLLAGGGQRSHSLGKTDNPYWLANTLPDRERLRQLISNLTLSYQLSELLLGYTVSLERQRNNSHFGLPATAAGYPAGRLTSRDEASDVFRSSFSSSYKPWRWFLDSNLDIGLLYDFNYGQREVNRQNGFGFAAGEPLAIPSADSVSAFTASRTRQWHEVRAHATFNYKSFLHLNVYNRSYFSSTAKRGLGFLPGVGFFFSFTDLPPFSKQSVVSSGKIRSTYGKTAQEASLFYSNWHYASTILPIAQYQGYFEAQELPFAAGLQPEVLHKFEVGTELTLWDRINLEFNHFQHFTRNAFFSVNTPAGFSLTNGADMINRGFDGSLRYHLYGNRLLWSVALTWSRSNPVVQRLYHGNERIPLAGFAEVSTNLVEGQPVGVLYGSTFQRNENGERLIGPDGFPLVNRQLSRIGNPNPDWTAGLANTLSWKDLSLGLVVDVRKGGDIWNGTGQALNYYGVSGVTGEERAVRNYLFTGVKPDGSPNDVPVDLANPANGLAGNRWVRYGLEGVAEEAVRDGSWVRLNEVRLSYNFTRLLRSWLPRSDVRLSFIGKNLLLLTRYPGTDPSAALFGYNWGTGLDFFNMPNTRSYGLSLHVKL